MWFKSRFTITAVAAISFCLIGGTSPAYADLGDQLAKLLADDGAASDLFGFTVAISGTTAIVGAHRDDDNGDLSGSAYLFDTITGDQIAKLLADDGAVGDFFGYSVAISGATAIVGALGGGSGSAYLFDTATGAQIAKLLPNDGAAGNLFGFSVAISGATAIVGARLDDDNGFNSGSAYLFDTTTGRQIAKLLPNDGAANDLFGESVAISGATAIVGAYLDDDNGSSSGSAYLFDAATGRQIIKLLPNDGAAGHAFGIFVAISGAPGKETAIVGAPFDDDNGEFSGSAYLFDATTGRQIAKLLSSDGAAQDNFGRSVAISDATAIVGARFDDDNNGINSGTAYLFDTITGDQIAKLLADDGAVGDFFGYSVAISGATAIVGAHRDDDNGINSGSAYLFDASSCPWDLDNTASVSTSDLLILFAQWGTAGPADFDGSGAVGTSDLLILFANWGPCP
ncbi:MAG: FG-GAP repeat protein [Planctomycetes bacterium]|nr:FG-GAP repeat protein [Planctomycetota bacterium]